MLADLYSSETHARSVNMHIAPATTKKNQCTVSDYYAKMTHYADELVASSAPLCDYELITYLLIGLAEDYNLIFTVVVARVNPISPKRALCPVVELRATYCFPGAWPPLAGLLWPWLPLMAVATPGVNLAVQIMVTTLAVAMDVLHVEAPPTVTTGPHATLGAPDRSVRCASRSATLPTIIGIALRRTTYLNRAVLQQLLL
jgi:hypothetical protein